MSHGGGWEGSEKSQKSVTYYLNGPYCHLLFVKKIQTQTVSTEKQHTMLP